MRLRAALGEVAPDVAEDDRNATSRSHPASDATLRQRPVTMRPL